MRVPTVVLRTRAGQRYHDFDRRVRGIVADELPHSVVGDGARARSRHEPVQVELPARAARTVADADGNRQSRRRCAYVQHDRSVLQSTVAADVCTDVDEGHRAELENDENSTEKFVADRSHGVERIYGEEQARK